MENHIVDLIKKSLMYYDNQNNKYSKYLKNTVLYVDKDNMKSKILNKIENDNDIENTENYEVEPKINIKTEILGIFHHISNVFLWSWSLPYLGINETKTSRELLNYGLNLDPMSNTISHFYLKSLLVNARNYIESDYDLDLIQAISSYILKDKFSFIYPSYTYGKNETKKVITTYFLVKISSN